MDPEKGLEPQSPYEHDDVPEDDAVIGRAFRRSLGVLAAVGALALLATWFLRQGDRSAPEVGLETGTPVDVERDATAPSLPFTDITTDSGIDFVHHNGATGEKLLPETMGSGAAFFDFDDDLDQDLLLVNGAPWPHGTDRSKPTSALYRNDGQGRFEDVTAQAGLDHSFYGTGVAAADVDGDGLIDLFFAAVGPNRLLRNVGGRFEDVTAQAGVAGDRSDWSTGAAFFDADGDGDLDLFVANYVRWSRDIDHALDYRLTGVGRAYGPPANYEGTFSYLYRNQGDGRFSDVSEASGIRVRNPATDVAVGKGLGLAPVDIDRDGHMDLLVANDTVGNFFFHNRGDGTFEESGELFGLAYGRNGEATGAMGVDAGHYRNDGELGFAIGNFANEMTSLYISQGDPTLFADEAIADGVGAPSRTQLSFGVLLFDADLDGRLDLLQANGHLENEINTVDPSQTYEQPTQLFWNAGPDARQTFVAVPAEGIGDLARPLVGRASAYADIDGDGDLDLLLTQTGRRPLLLRNDQSLGHHWLRVELVGEQANRQAIGAVVELVADGVTQRRQVMPTRGYLSQSEQPLTFGLGDAAKIDSLTVFWPNGDRQQVEPEGIEIDRALVIQKPS